LPVGVPVPWPTTTPPTGWLRCNGAIFDKIQYPTLAIAYPNAILPDLRGVFIRGWDDGRGLDAGRGILSYAPDTLRKHTHALLFGQGSGDDVPAVNEEFRQAASNSYYAYSGRSGLYITESGQSETAPCNIAFSYIVRAA